MSALVVALYENHAAAEQVRTQLVTEGFPTDRVELTSRSEPGQAAAVGPSSNLGNQLEEYFTQLFEQPESTEDVGVFVQGVRQGRAAITVHPRGDVETRRALEILKGARPLELRDRDLDEQGMERAATPDDTKPVVKKVIDATREKARDVTGGNRTKH